MTRAEWKRQNRREKQKKATYSVTREQLDKLIEEEYGEKLKEIQDKVHNEAVNDALVLLLTLPLEVLMDHYWTDSYEELIPEFTNYVIEYYEKWQNDELDMDVLKEDLWNYAGVKLLNPGEEMTDEELV